MRFLRKGAGLGLTGAKVEPILTMGLMKAGDA